MSDPDRLAILTCAETEWEAETIAAALRARDIPVQVEGGYVAGWRADTPARAKVMVFRRDVERARRAAREVAFTGASIDWDDLDVGAPEEPARADHAMPRTVRALLLGLGLLAWALLGAGTFP